MVIIFIAVGGQMEELNLQDEDIMFKLAYLKGFDWEDEAKTFSQKSAGRYLSIFNFKIHNFLEF